MGCGADAVRQLTLVLPYYRNLGMFLEHQRIWATWPESLRARLHVIVVDDGSPKEFRIPGKAVTITGLASLRRYRILKDIRWNWLACRNLGMSQATTDWVLLTDIDHVLPAEALEQLTTMDLDPAKVYRLGRVDAPHPWPYTLSECPVREAKRFHPNTWLLTRAMFERIGGYDERLSGCYGTDGEFKDRVRKQARAVVQLGDALMVRYGREILPDASTTVFTRKNDAANDAELLRRRTVRDEIKNWKPLRLTFPWEQVA